ncbi:hypothetical protein NB640_08900 [Oxalobacter vibrioformis]|uniref:DUF883 domain-containing protein n=1 Tax=Oxalobacter vibrioformis TaxID=933080 RepID=A0A9E9LUE7_9BURK|nr:hypothetical protein [Oxalobacter vibrioformis]NLC23522.1 hypothetical protein [Oxalobacter sp.]WAW09366.1 hypothetical protein NB640_08900 [Oxalobacter vibrioformis]
MKDLNLCKLKLRYEMLRAKHYANQQMREAKGRIEEKPLACLTAALGLGIVIGKLLSRH